MKLNDFFQTQKNLSFTDVDKLELYQKFLYKKNVKAPVKRFSFVHAKSFVYTLIIAIFFVGLYGVYFFNEDALRFNANIVQADYIAKVMSFSGSFSIEHQGKISKTENISNGDTIILKPESEMIFEINSGTKSKIIGPAKLTIQRFDNAASKYKLNLIYGDYIQMENDKIPQNIELAIDDILIKQADNTKPMSFQFINEGQGHVLKNNGSSLMVTKNGNIKETEIKNKQILTIQNSDIKLFNNRENFAQAIQKGEVSQTFAVSTSQYTGVKTTVTDIGTGTEEESPISLMTLLLPSNETTLTTEVSEKNAETISKDITSLLGSNKSLLTPEQNSTLRSTLGAYALNADIKEAYTTQLSGGDGSVKIQSVVKKVYALFGLEYTNDTISANITNLSTILQEKYEIPPTYISNLSILKSRLTALTSLSADTVTTREEFQTTLPSNLIFK